MLLKCNASGSSGNNYVLASEGEILLLEAGTKSKDMLKSIDYKVGDVAGCLISHEHG